MQPLLKIQTVPIKIEAQRTKAQFKEVEMPIKQAPQSKPVQIRQPAQHQVIQQQKQMEVQHQAIAAQDAARRSSQQVQAQAYDSQQGTAPISDVAATEQTALPLTGQGGNAPQPSVEAQPFVSRSSFDYQMDRETFEWNNSEMPQLEYVPSTIEYSVTQYPDVIIEYVGDPIYVPASSNPNYVPPKNQK